MSVTPVSADNGATDATCRRLAVRKKKNIDNRRLLILVVALGFIAGCTADGRRHNEEAREQVASQQCYRVLEPDVQAVPPVLGESDPVCAVIAENMNRFCGESPQYDHRRFDPLVTQLKQPRWEALPVERNLDLLRRMYLPYAEEEVQTSWWNKERDQLLRFIERGEVRLFKAEVNGVDLRGGSYTIFKVENRRPDAPRGFNQPSTMISSSGEEVPSEIFRTVQGLDRGDIIRISDRWLVLFYLTYDRRFSVSELIRPIGDTVGSKPLCTIQHRNDR